MTSGRWGLLALLAIIVAGACAFPAVAASPSPDPAPVTTTQPRTTPPPPAVVTHPVVVAPTPVSQPAQTTPKTTTTRPVVHRHHAAKAKKKAPPVVHYQLQSPQPQPAPASPPQVTVVKTPPVVDLTPASGTSSWFMSKLVWIGVGLLALALGAALLVKRLGRVRKARPVTIEESVARPATIPFVHSYLKSIGRR